jgi:TonB family protein
MIRINWRWVIAGLGLGACTRSIYPVATAPARTLSPTVAVLTARTWREAQVLAYRIRGDDTIRMNYTAQLPKTDRDDQTIFFPDGTFLFEEGKTKHDTSSTQRYLQGNWRLNPDETTLTLEAANSSDTYTILRISKDSLVVGLLVPQETVRTYYIISYAAKPPLKPTGAVYTDVDIPPAFPGGMPALHALINRNLRYPKSARMARVEGDVIVQWIVNPDGSASDFELVQGIGYGCDAEVMTFLQGIPRWSPGIYAGEAVRVQMRMPVVFKLH